MGLSIGSKAITERDVELAYEFNTGRKPENSLVVAGHLKRNSSRKELRAAFMASAEHRAQIFKNVGNSGSKPLDWPKIDIEVEVSPDKLAAMIHRIEQSWASLGATEPHWSVLTNEKFKVNEIGKNIDEFYHRKTSGFVLHLCGR